MKKTIFFTTVLLFSACTIHQNERIQELVAPPQLAFELRNRHFVLDALHRSRDAFALSIEPVPILNTSRDVLPVYLLKADGLPTHERFLLASFDPLKNIVTPQFEFEVLENSALKIFTAKGEETSTEAPFVLKDLLHGQPIELAVFSKENNIYAHTQFTPHPFETTIDDADFSLSVIHRKGTHFLLEGQGLVPGEQLVITEHSGSQMTRHSLVADQSGSISLPVEPIVLGRLGGPAHLTISRVGAESRIDYFWGGRLEIESVKASHFHPLVLAVNRDPQEELNFLALLPKIDQKLYL